ncbi:MAG: hypothetical protein EOO23_05970 [Comamonadaceae bacterium]|nr:MAG: hypothetical protein EOO23_05970 [Comamonadaceae bacterium]
MNFFLPQASTQYMVNVKTPAQPVHKHGAWPPKNSKEYPLPPGANWWSVAKFHHMAVWDLIAFNFKTRVPEEVNYYMRELIGCKFPSKDGYNYSFTGADPARNKIYVPLGHQPPAPAPVKKDFDYFLQELWIETVNSGDPRTDRILCMLSNLQKGVDDRVIFWNHIAPDDQTPVPAHLVRRRDIATKSSAVDPAWFAKNIVIPANIDMQPTGNGIGVGNKFVTSLRKAFVDLQPNLVMFRGMHDQIIETHRTLANWADASEGGSSSMPTEYRAVKTWLKWRTDSDQSVLNCVITAGT